MNAKSLSLIAGIALVLGVGVPVITAQTDQVGEPTVVTYRSERLYDSRTIGDKLPAGSTVQVNVPLAESLYLTVSVVRPDGTGFVSLDGGATSILTWTGTGTTSSLTLKETFGASQLPLFVSVDTHLLVDLVAMNNAVDAPDAVDVPVETTTSPTTPLPPTTAGTPSPTTTTPAPPTTATTPPPTTTTPPPTTTTPQPTTTTPPPTTTLPPATTTPPPTTTTLPSSDCGPETTGQADLASDLISLHYDHAPDLDDGHATVAGREVATVLEFEPWVIGGAYGVGNASTYDPDSEAVMDATWGSDGWNDAHADWAGVVQATADRWEQVLATCGDVWVAEGGQADLTADVVRELLDRQPGLDTEARIHVVQHSFWNEGQSDPGDLAFVKANTDYEKIDDGNALNDTAGLNRTPGTQFFIDSALAGRHSSAWEAAFDYYNPNGRVDFSDTVELLEIVGVGTDEVADIDDFADVFIRSGGAAAG